MSDDRRPSHLFTKTDRPTRKLRIYPVPQLLDFLLYMARNLGLLVSKSCYQHWGVRWTDLKKNKVMNISPLRFYPPWSNCRGKTGQGEKKFFFFLWLPRRRSNCWKKLRWSCYPIGIYLCLKHGKIWRPEGRKEGESLFKGRDTVNALPRSRFNRICHVTRGRRKKRKAAADAPLCHAGNDLPISF